MKKLIIAFTTTIILMIYSLSFVNGQDIIDYHNSYDKTIDVTTMATPDGAKLRSAVNGPVRSVLGEPSIDLNSYELNITGLVDSSLTLTWKEIKNLPAAYTDTIIMYCVEGWEVWGNWKGILVKDLLQKVSIQSKGKYVLFSCADGYTTALPVSYVLKYNAMLAYQVNDSLLKKQSGFPLRLIAFGKYGYKWAKWVNKLTLIKKPQKGYWEKRGYSDQADVPIKRRRYYEGKNAKPLKY